MMNTQEALKMAIEAMEMSNDLIGYGLTDFTKYNLKTDSDVYAKLISTINTCKDALAQPQPKLFLDLSNSNGNHPVQQEPYGYWVEYGEEKDFDMAFRYPDKDDYYPSDIKSVTKLYTNSAPAREPLSEDEINKMAIDCGFETRMKDIVVKHSNGSWIEVGNRLNELARAIEKAHGIGE